MEAPLSRDRKGGRCVLRCGPCAVVPWADRLWVISYGPHLPNGSDDRLYEIAPDLGHWGVEIVGRVKASAKAISGPTSPPGKYPQLLNAPGSETGPGPQLVTWGKSTILSIDAHGFKFEYTLNSAKHIPFDWSGP